MAGTAEAVSWSEAPIVLREGYGTPVSPEEYVPACVETLATQGGTDALSTATLAAPLVELLTTTPNWDGAHHETMCALADGYRPSSSAELREYKGRINEAQASRNLVAEVIWTTQSWAFENDDPALSAQMVRVAEYAIHKELTEGGDLKAAPGLLIEVVRRAVIRERQEASICRLDKVVPFTGWHYKEDAVNIGRALGGALLADRLDLRQPEVADFMLEQWGLDPEDMRHAWKIGYKQPKNFYPERPSTDPVVAANLKRIAQIEQKAPSIASFLRETNGIRCFARLSPQFLCYLAVQEKFRRLPKADPRVAAWSDQEPVTTAAIVIGSSDHLDAFNRPEAFDKLLHEVTALGRVLAYYEVANTEKFYRVWEDLEVRGVKHLLEGAHSTGKLQEFDPTLPVAEGVFTVNDLIANEERIQKTHASIVDIALWGCNAGVSGGLADIYTSMVRRGMIVTGARRILGTKLWYTKDGFGMREDRNASPTPVGLLHTRSDWAGALLGIVQPAFKEYRRFSPEAEEARMSLRLAHIDSL